MILSKFRERRRARWLGTVFAFAAATLAVCASLASTPSQEPRMPNTEIASTPTANTPAASTPMASTPIRSTASRTSP
jgi:subtilase-type serine protease